MKWLLSLIFLAILSTSILPSYAFKPLLEIQDIPSIEDPSPGYWEVSEYMIGSVAVGIILPESNGTVDPSTEDWTDTEIEKVLSEIQHALDWWASQNPDANVSFVTEVHARVPTSYELINHNSYSSVFLLAYDEIMTNLGYPGTRALNQLMDYANDLREIYHTDWAFIISVYDSSNDPDGCLKDGLFAFAAPGGPEIVMTYDNNGWGINRMDKVCAGEIAHIFWATDEYRGGTEYRGYLNVPDVEGSGCIMDGASGGWCLSGKPYGLEGTWGQVGWRDSDGDGIQDIVDTFPLITLDETPSETTNITLKYHGRAAVVPYPNQNPSSRNPDGPRNVTINKIKQVEYRIDSGEWIPANATDGAFGDPIENFTLVTNPLEEGNHTVEIKATNQWGNEGFANTTIEIMFSNDLNNDGIVNMRDMNIVARAWQCTPGDDNWNPVADINGDEIINMFDMYFVAKNFGHAVSSEKAHYIPEVDFNNDYVIDKEDMKILAEAFGSQPGDENWNSTVDLNEDSVINIGDLDEVYKVFALLTVDTNEDEIINIIDVSTVALAYGSSPGHEQWNVKVDFDDNNLINIIDISIAASEYGKDP